jgi:hypothetical protein
MIKSIVISIIVIFALVNINAQSLKLDCSLDSISYKYLNTFLDTSDYHTITMKRLDYTILKNQQQKRDCFCNLLIYAKLFDYLLKNGLDLSYSIVKNPPIMNSFFIIEAHTDTKKHKLNSDFNNTKHKLYWDFLFLKKSYEDYVVKSYKNNKTKSLEIDVNNIIFYNIYTNPNTLQDILLSKYEHLTRDKMEKEWQDYEKLQKKE